MPRPPAKPPTDLELDILKVLWKSHPASVQQVRDGLAPERDLAYTTVMTMLGIMYGKRLVKRSMRNRKYFYSPVHEAAVTSKNLVRMFVDRVFDGSVAAMMHSLLGDEEVDEEELQRIARLVHREKQRRAEKGTIGTDDRRPPGRRE